MPWAAAARATATFRWCGRQEITNSTAPKYAASSVGFDTSARMTSTSLLEAAAPSASSPTTRYPSSARRSATSEPMLPRPTTKTELGMGDADVEVDCPPGLLQHADQLLVDELLDAVSAEFPAEARSLDAAEWQFGTVGEDS